MTTPAQNRILAEEIERERSGRDSIAIDSGARIGLGCGAVLIYLPSGVAWRWVGLRAARRGAAGGEEGRGRRARGHG